MKRKLLSLIVGFAACCMIGSIALAMDYTSPDTIKKVQEALNAKGYNCGTPDGISGSGTRAQIQKYRNDNSLADNNEIDEELITSLGIAEADGEATNASIESIMFRDIEWYDSEKNVKSAVEKIEGIKPSFYLPVDEGARIDEWYRQWSNMYSDINIENGGTMLRYSGISVAGYDTDLELSFMYPIENGKVLYDTDSSKFYKAEYKLEELEDFEGAYEDLCTKLTGLYGQGEDKSYFNDFDDKMSPQGTVWKAADGSLVWIGIYYNSYSEKYDECWIVYAAPNSSECLKELSDQMLVEAVDAEAQSREENSSNVDGL